MLIAPLERAAEFTGQAVRMLGIAQTSDHVALDEKDDITTFRAVQAAGEKAYKMAGVTPPDIQFAEMHDCFTIAEIIATEDLGFVKKGEGGPYALAGCTCAERRAAGEYQRRAEVERASGGRDRASGRFATSCMQIRGEAGERQMARHSIGLAQNLGGSGRPRW